MMLNNRENYSFDVSEYRMDDLQRNGFVLFQDPNDFCFGTDAVLLADFAAKRIKRSAVILDLCAGNGVIPILFYARRQDVIFTAVEIRARACALAQYNVSYNHLQNQIQIVQSDLKELPKTMHNQFDAITVNPPYVPVGNGIVSDGAVSVARHEITADLDDVLRCASIMLKDRGALFMVHKPHRTAELITKMNQYHLQPKEIRFVYPKVNENASLVLISAVKNAGIWTDILAPLILYQKDGTQTDELNEIYNGEFRW